MDDKMYHVVDWVVMGIPLWVGLIYFVVVMRLYPPHRHINGKIEYPPRFAPGKVEDLHP